MVKKLVFIIIILGCVMPQAFAQEQKVKVSEVVETYRGQKVYIHFVEQGETISALARAYGVSVEQIKATNPDAPEVLKAYQIIMIPYGKVVTTAPPKEAAAETPAPRPATPQPEVNADGKKIHTIEPKETWYALSRQYEIPVRQLIEANPGVDTLKIGQTINIPDKAIAIAPVPGEVSDKPGYKLYTVSPKETLYSISREYKTTVDELIRLNPALSEGLKDGQKIYLPSTAATPAPTVVAQQPVTQQKPADYIEHRVEKKETLYSISKQYDVSSSDILKLNPGIGGVLRRGDVLRIPVKKAAPAPVDRPQTPDTVVLGRDVYQPAEVPFAADCKPGVDSRVFKIALIVPFSLEKLDEIVVSGTTDLTAPEEYASFDFIQFYQGALIGLDAAAEKGIKLQVEVLDSDEGNGTSKTRQIIASGKLDGSHLIIGPLFAESFELVAAYAEKRKIPIVNPLSQRAEILSNPRVIKIQPSNWTLYNVAAKQLVETYPNTVFTVVRRNATENSSMADAFEAALHNLAAPGNFKTVNYAQQHEQGVLNAMVAGRKNMVLLLTNDKAFIPAVLRRLYDKQEAYNLMIMGMPEWENMEIDIHYLKSLQTHFYTPRFVDYEDESVKSFIIEFKKRYVAEPELDKYAFMGYDLARYFAQALYTYGPDFMNCLADFPYDGLSVQFRFYHSDKGGYDNSGMFVYRYNGFTRKNILKP